MTTDAAAQGRANLAVWEASKPVNFFTADANLQSVLRRILGDAAYVRTEANLTRFGGQVATALDQWAREEDLIGNHPRLDRYDGIGRRTEQVAFHPITSVPAR
jgi:hypothetical protein